tara:strand:- start:2526 stop:3596 length:1071 start_codon:yes stop_codon:yes gene_type:complete
MMGVRSKELIHSNILACFLKPSYPHGLGHLFVNDFVRSIRSLLHINAEPIPLSVLISATNSSSRVFRELENIDLVIEFPEIQFVIGVENKIHAIEQDKQIARYQTILETRYASYNKAIIYLTPTGTEPKTANINSAVPVYCMPYERIAIILKRISDKSNKSSFVFINQFIAHLERYMSGSNEVNELCWQVFEKNESAYKHMVKAYDYCIQRKLQLMFEHLDRKVNTDSMFSEWNGRIETQNIHSTKSKLTYDLDIRLTSWPEGVWVKVYKHDWFGVFPYIKENDILNSQHELLNNKISSYQQVKHWDKYYYISNNTMLDKERQIQEDGNNLSEDDLINALNRIKCFIQETNKLLGL